MTTAIEKTVPGDIIPPEKLTPDIVRKFICPKATEEEIFLFLQQSKLLNLNPFKRGEIYLIKYNDKDKASIVVGYETYLKRAATLEKLDGWKCETVGEPSSPDFKAVITIHRKDWKEPFVHEVYFEEYAQYKQTWVNGQPKGFVLTKFWREKKRTMIKKVAIGQGFRLCFPAEMGDLPYMAEEMPAGGEPLPVIDVDVVPGTSADVRKEPEQAPVETKAATTAPDGALCADDIADIYDKEHPSGRPARTLQMNKVFDWAAGRKDLFTTDKDGYFFKARAPEKKSAVVSPATSATPAETKATPTPPKETPAPTPAPAPTPTPARAPAQPNLPLTTRVGDVPIWVIAINNLLALLEREFGRDSDEIVNGKNGILARIRRGFKSNPMKIEDLNQKEGEWVLTVLQKTLHDEEAKAAAASFPGEDAPDDEFGDGNAEDAGEKS